MDSHLELNDSFQICWNWLLSKNSFDFHELAISNETTLPGKKKTNPNQL